MVCGVKSTDVPFLMPSVRFNHILKHSTAAKINGILIKRYFSLYRVNLIFSSIKKSQPIPNTILLVYYLLSSCKFNLLSHSSFIVCFDAFSFTCKPYRLNINR